MGLSVGEIIPKEEISLDDLSGKIIAVDAFNVLYQFLTTIRQPDGTPLMDSKGKITSHLSGLFYRTTNLMARGIKPIFVFDGKAPELKAKTQEARRELKKEAYEKLESAQTAEEKALYASRTAFLNEEMIEESKELISALGLPYIQAPAEGEAQASYIVHHGDAWAVGSQDYDALLFGADRLIQNLTLARKRKLPSGAYAEVRPQLIALKKVLSELGINRDQLICLGILVGTDYNPKGVKGIGQKTALKIVKEHKTPSAIFEWVKREKGAEVEWKEIMDLFKKHDVEKKYSVKFKDIDDSAMRKILLKHDFSEERIDSAIKKVRGEKEVRKQKRLENF